MNSIKSVMFLPLLALLSGTSRMAYAHDPATGITGLYHDFVHALETLVSSNLPAVLLLAVAVVVSGFLLGRR